MQIKYPLKMSEFVQKFCGIVSFRATRNWLSCLREKPKLERRSHGRQISAPCRLVK